MPNDRIRPESDGDPNTALEDTKQHERIGFVFTGEDFSQDLERAKKTDKNRP